jgi:hypothetical protein
VFCAECGHPRCDDCNAAYHRGAKKAHALVPIAEHLAMHAQRHAMKQPLIIDPSLASTHAQPEAADQQQEATDPSPHPSTTHTEQPYDAPDHEPPSDPPHSGNDVQTGSVSSDPSHSGNVVQTGSVPSGNDVQTVSALTCSSTLLASKDDNGVVRIVRRKHHHRNTGCGGHEPSVAGKLTANDNVSLHAVVLCTIYVYVRVVQATLTLTLTLSISISLSSM